MDYEQQGPLEPTQEAPGSEPSGRTFSRREVVVGAAIAGAGLAAALPGLGHARAWSPASRNAALKKGLASAMIGGPTGFPGAARYQYGPNTEEGRAVLAARALRKAGKAPDTLVVQALDFARPQFENVFPKGAKSSIAGLWEQETGIKIKFIETVPATEYQTNIRNASTKNGSFDLVTGAIEDTGDYAEAGLLRPLDDFVAKYKPSWSDPKYGYAGGRSVVQLFTQYNGQTYWVAFDNDTQPFLYRSDLFKNAKERANFEDKYGRPLDVPKTWAEHAEVAAFFTRPKDARPLYGAVERKSPFWGKVNWQHRFVCSADPNSFYFKEDGSANINNEAGIRAATEHLASLQWSEPGALSKDWLAQYQLMGSGNGVMGGTFANCTKLIVPANKQLDKGFGKTLRTDVQPGRIVNGKLVRRVVIHYNISYGVNAFAPKSHHEAAYLFLQWAGGARMYTYLTANPTGYQDPHHTYSLNDPLVVASYGAQPMRAFKEIIARTAPPITLRGAGEYGAALDEELQKMLTKQQTPEKAMANVEKRWNATTKRLGTAKQAKAIKASYAAFPKKGTYGPTKTIA
jgi:multiple sugar transport system substrate-binding protein